MQTFNFSFNVNAPLTAVSSFHHDTSVLKKLTPPPVFMQIHSFEPLAEGSRAEFTLWYGPIPIRWRAVHSNVGPDGFTDTQERGPLKYWQHTHRFTALSPSRTAVDEHIDYQYRDGLTGLISRLLFNQFSLYLLFTARKWITKRSVE